MIIMHLLQLFINLFVVFIFSVQFGIIIFSKSIINQQLCLSLVCETRTCSCAVHTSAP